MASIDFIYQMSIRKRFLSPWAELEAAVLAYPATEG